MSPHQTLVLQKLHARGAAQTAASLASAASLRVVGTSIALQALRADGCVDGPYAGYWHITVAGADAVRVAS